MATTIGSVDFIVDLDGRAIPGQAKILGAIAGKIAAMAFDREYQNQMRALTASMRSRFLQLGQASGKALGQGVSRSLMPQLSSLQKSIGSAFNGGAIQGFRGDLRGASVDLGDLVATVDRSGQKAITAGNGFRNFGARFAAAGEAAENFSRRLRGIDGDKLAAIFGRMSGGIGRFVTRLRESDGPTKRFFTSWKELPHGFRQIVFYIALFATLSSQIAILGSVAGSSLVVLATTALAGAAGIGVLIAGLKGVAGPLSGIAPMARPGVAALKELGSGFSAIQDSIQGALFENLAGPLRELTTKLLPVLNVGLTAIASSMGNVIALLSTSLTTPEALTTMDALLKGLAPILESFGAALIKLGGALGTIFVASLPYAQMFSDYLLDIFTRFDTWLSSLEGQSALTEWFENGKSVMEAIVPLLSAVGTMLNALVTPETITIFNGALASLTSFIPVLGGLLTVIANLDIIGLFAQALDAVGAVLTPLIPSLTTLASVIATIVGGALSALVPILVPVAEVLSTLIERVSAFALQALPPLIAILEPLAGLIADVLVFALGLAMELFEQLSEPVLALLGAIQPLVPLIATLAGELMSVLGPAFGEIVGFVGQLIVALLPIITAILPPLVRLFSSLVPVLDLLIGAVLSLLAPFLELITPLLGLVEMILPPLIDLFSFLIGAALQPLMMVLNILIPTLLQVIQAFLPLITDILPPLMELFFGTIEALKPLFDAFMDLYGPVNELISPLTSMLEDIMPSLSEVISFLVTSALTPLRLAFDVLIPVIQLVIGLLAATFKGAITTVTTLLKGLGDFLSLVFKGKWEEAWKSVGKTFDNVWKGIQSTGKTAMNAIIDFVNQGIKAINTLLDGISKATGGAISLSIPTIPKLAAGTIATRSMLANIGEAGPEAVVPLNRPLSQVDPSVRALSAYAQGKGDTSTTTVDRGKSVTIEAGAIVIQGSSSPAQTALAVIDHIVEDL